MAADSLSVADASQKLGVSIPTIKAMYRRRQLAGFLTPGGHLRIFVESIASQGHEHVVSSTGPSSALKSRRERIEFLNLEGEELRVQRELDRLRSETAEEDEQRASERRAQDIEREERLEQARAERIREERLQQQAVALQRRTKLRQQILAALNLAMPSNLSPDRQRTLAEDVERELERANADDAEEALPIVKAVCQRFVASIVVEGRDRRLRETILKSGRSEIASMWGSTDLDETDATAAAQNALSSLGLDSSERELRCAVKVAIAPIRQRVESRQQERRAATERERHRNQWIESAVTEVEPYLERLKRAGEFEVDSVFVARLKDTVRAKLGQTIATQALGETRRLVHEIIDSEIEGLG